MLLVTLDTPRADRLGSYGRRDAGRPELDALAAGGLRFDQAQSAVPLTLPSHATMLSGLLPPCHGLRDTARGRCPPTCRRWPSTCVAPAIARPPFVGAFAGDPQQGEQRLAQLGVRLRFR